MSPEEEELERKQQELLTLEAQLVDAEEQLATLRAEVDSFRIEYVRRAGPLLHAVDALRFELAQREMERNPSSGAAERRSEAQRRSEGSSSAPDDDGTPAFLPSADLRSLFREAARLLHPDLASTDAERVRRNDVMAQINIAYRRGDVDALKRIVAGNAHAPEDVSGDGAAAELVRVIRKLSRARNRLEAIAKNRAELMQTELWELFEQHRQSTERGDDLVAEICANAGREAERLRRRLRHGG